LEAVQDFPIPPLPYIATCLTWDMFYLQNAQSFAIGYTRYPEGA